MLVDLPGNMTSHAVCYCTNYIDYQKTDGCHEKTDLKVFVIVIPKEGWARVAMAAPILLWV